MFLNITKKLIHRHRHRPNHHQPGKSQGQPLLRTGTLHEITNPRIPGGHLGQGRVEEIPPQTSPIPTPGASSSDTVITAHIEPVGALWPNLPFGSEVEVRRKR